MFGSSVEASFFGLVVGAVELFCRLSSIVGWGCFAVVRDLVNSLCPLSHSSELLYAADTGNDYNYRLEERRDGAVSRVVCSVLFFVLLRHVMLLCPRDIN